MYAKPIVRPLDAATAVSSCTPCPARYSSDDPTFVHVTPWYTQVGDQGFCYPKQLGGKVAVNVQFNGLHSVSTPHPLW
jgi:hypothetical protein